MDRKRPELRDPHVPRFPVIIEDPTFKQVRGNMNQADFIQSAVVGVASFPLGYIVGASVRYLFILVALLTAGECQNDGTNRW